MICLFKSFSIDSKEISFNRAASLNDSRSLTIELNSFFLLGQLRLPPLGLSHSKIKWVPSCRTVDQCLDCGVECLQGNHRFFQLPLLPSSHTLLPTQDTELPSSPSLACSFLWLLTWGFRSPGPWPQLRERPTGPRNIQPQWSCQ